jgi:hypothetical protein
MTKARKADGRMVTAHLKHVQEPTSGISAEPLRMASPAGSIASRWPRSLACANTRSSLRTTFTAAFSRETARSHAGGFAFRGAPRLHVLAASVLAVTMLAGCVGGESSGGGGDLAGAESSIFAAAKPDWTSTNHPSYNGRGNGPDKDSSTDSTTDTSTDSTTDTSTDSTTDTSTDSTTDTSTDSTTDTSTDSTTDTSTTWYVALQAIDDKGQYSPDSNETQGKLASGEHVTLVWEAPNMTLDGACTTVDGYLVKLGTASGDYSHSVSVSAYDHGLSCTATDTNQCGSTYTCEIAVEVPAT